MSDLQEPGFKVNFATFRGLRASLNFSIVFRDPRRVGQGLRKLQRRREKGADKEGNVDRRFPPRVANRVFPQTNGIFEIQVKNAEGKEATWTIDLKTDGTIYKGKSKAKPNVTIILSDDTFQQLADGKVRRRFRHVVGFVADQALASARRPESVHDREVEDKGKHDVCYQARWCSEGAPGYTNYVSSRILTRCPSTVSEDQGEAVGC